MTDSNNRHHFYEVSKKALIITAGIIWMIAGFNVVRLGILSYMEISTKWWHYVLSVVVFFAFGAMFFKLTRKNIKRIKSYAEDYRPIWNFFNIKSYIIMAIMMGGGIGLRNAGIFPEVFVAFFYTGLVCALFLAGVCFVVNYFLKRE